MKPARVVRLGTPQAKGAVRIDRKTRWGNPFIIGKDGDRLKVINHYRAWLWKRLKNEPDLIHAVANLHGRTLACHCAPKPCHGQVLARAAAWAYRKTHTMKDPLRRQYGD
ncbi:MAG: DUF4326 domain-containing protein [Acidobacteria bacterium]|nr:DUF4326 domain-containing protein [Acidobacteriota bacterium]